MNFPTIRIPWKVEEAPPIFSEERKYRNWQQRRVEIIVSGIAGVVFAAVAIGCCFSPVALIASPIFGALSLACLGYSLSNLILRKPVPLPLPTWNKWILPAIAVGAIFPQFRIGALCGAAGFASHIIIEKITNWMFPKFRQKLDVVTWEKRPPGSFDKYRDFYDFDGSIETPIIEEVMFRGLLQPMLSGITKSEDIGLIGSSLLFGALHYSSYRETIYTRIHSVIGATLKGFMFGWLNNRYGLMASIGAHVLNNSLSTLCDYLKYDLQTGPKRGQQHSLFKGL